MAFYLRTENGKIEFLTDEIHEIKETDMLLTDEEYNKFFELQSQGVQYRLKEVSLMKNSDIGLFDNIEEFESEEIPIEKSETQIQIEVLKKENETLKKENEVLRQDVQSIKEMLGISED